jgi:hypothetical protein
MKLTPKLLAAGIVTLLFATSIAASTVASVSAAANQNCSVSTPIKDRPPLRYGDTGTCVTVAQGLLTNVHTFHGNYTTNFLSQTDAAVRQAQRNAHITANGIIGQDTWNMLAKSSPATQRATANNSKTRNCDNQHYRTICVIKGNNGSAGKLYAIQNGAVVMTFDIRTSDSRHPVGDKWHQTSEGRLKVTNKAAGFDYPMYYDDYTDNVNASNGQQAIRYSPMFAKCGYDGNLSGTKCVTDYHGAVNGGVDLKSLSDAKQLYQWSNTGTEIVILHDPNASV